MRAYGPAVAVELARAMTVEDRQAAAEVAVEQLLPKDWYDTFLGSTHAITQARAGLSATADAALLAELHTDGTLPWQPPPAPPT